MDTDREQTIEECQHCNQGTFGGNHAACVERAAIVAWLRGPAPAYPTPGDPALEQKRDMHEAFRYATDLADAIERGEHVPR